LHLLLDCDAADAAGAMLLAGVSAASTGPIPVRLPDTASATLG